MTLIAINLVLCSHESSVSYSMQRYLLMLLVAAETIHRTCIATILYLISNVSTSTKLKKCVQGWDIMRFYFEPEEASRVAKCLGVAYVCHSAYFVTIDAVSMHYVLRVS